MGRRRGKRGGTESVGGHGASSKRAEDGRREVSAAGSGTTAGSWNVLVAGMVAILLVVGITYWPVTRAQAVFFDDPQYVLKNPLVQQPGWDSAMRFFREVFEPSTVRGYYQPLTMVSLMLDRPAAAGAEDMRPYRRTNLLLHLANTGLVVLLLYAMFRNVWGALAAGAVFGVHPQTVEVVAWVVERKTLLATLFALGALLCYVRYARRGGWGVYVAAAVCYVLSLLAKPTTTMVPVVMLLLDVWPFRRIGRRAVMEKIPLFVITAVSIVVTIISQASAAGLRDTTERGPLSIPLVVCHNIVFYLVRFVWPADLSWQVPFPEPLALSAPSVLWGVIGTVVLLAVLGGVWRWRRGPLIGWGVFFAGVLPAMGIIGFTFVIAADKYAYFPMLGYLLWIAAGVGWIVNRASGERERRIAVWGVCVVAVVVVAFAARATRHYLGYWQETERLHRYVLEQVPGAYSVRFNLGLWLEEHGEPDRALREYALVARERPEHAAARNAQGRVCLARGEVEQAVEHYRAFVRLAPEDPEAHYNLAVALQEQGAYDEAIASYEAALRARPNWPAALLNLGNVRFVRREYRTAIDYYSRAIEQRPNYALGYVNRANTHITLGDLAAARDDLRRVLQIDPGRRGVREKLAEVEAVLDSRAP